MSENLLDGPVSLKRDEYKSAGADCVNGCPCVTIDGPEALEFPHEFLVTFKATRGPIVARSASRKEKASASVQLHLHTLCSIEPAEADEEGELKTGLEEDEIDKLFNRAAETKEDGETE